MAYVVGSKNRLKSPTFTNASFTVTLKMKITIKTSTRSPSMQFSCPRKFHRSQILPLHWVEIQRLDKIVASSTTTHLRLQAWKSLGLLKQSIPIAQKKWLGRRKTVANNDITGSAFAKSYHLPVTSQYRMKMLGNGLVSIFSIVTEIPHETEATATDQDSKKARCGTLEIWNTPLA